jgi:transposase-like protein
MHGVASGVAMNAAIRRHTTEIKMDNRFDELDPTQQFEVNSYINSLASNPGDAPFKAWHDYDCQDPEQRKQAIQACVEVAAREGEALTITQVYRRSGYNSSTFYKWRDCARVSLHAHQAIVRVLSRTWKPNASLDVKDHQELIEQRVQAVEEKVKALKARQVEHEQKTKRQITKLIPLSQVVANKMGIATPTNGTGTPSTALLARIREACDRAKACNRDARSGFPVDTDLAQALQDIERLAKEDRTI